MANQTIQKTTDTVNKDKIRKLGTFYLIIFLLMLSSNILYSDLYSVILLTTVCFILLIWGIWKGVVKKYANILKMFIFSSVCVGLVTAGVAVNVMKKHNGFGFIFLFSAVMFGIVILSSPLINTSLLLSIFRKIKNSNFISKSSYLKPIIQLMTISSVCFLASNVDILAYLVRPCTITGMCSLPYDINITAGVLILALPIIVFFTAFYSLHKKTIPTFWLNLIVGIMSIFILNPTFSTINAAIVIACFCLWFFIRFIVPLIIKIGPNITTKPISINRMFYLSVPLLFFTNITVILTLMCFYTFLFKRFKWCLALVIMLVIFTVVSYYTQDINQEAYVPSQWCAGV